MKLYIKSNTEPSGYWQAVMRYYPEEGSMQEYYAFTTGYDRSEAQKNLKSELIGEEKEDQIFTIEPISEEEYKEGMRRFGEGERWR